MLSAASVESPRSRKSHHALYGKRVAALAVVALAAVLVSTMGTVRASSLVAQTQLEGSCIPKFATPLPVFGPAGSIHRVKSANHPKLTVSMKEIDQAVLPKGMTDTCGKGVTFGKTRVWAHETSDTQTKKVIGPANWPAVTIEAQRNVATRVKFDNQLPSFNSSNPTGPGLVQGLIPVDQTIHWADPLGMGCGMKTSIDCSLPTGSADPCCQQYVGPVPATVHLHGAVIQSAFDGGPDTWFTPEGINGSGYTTLGKPGAGKAIYKYINSQEAGTMWFHDHTLGVTRLNVYAGLAGFYLLRDPKREPKGLPSDAYEVEMAIQDRKFDTNSQLYFPTETQLLAHPFWSVMFEGDVAMVNGAPWPYMNVEPRRYRLRLLNGSNHRAYDLSFGNASVYQIDADENYLDKPVKVTAVFLGPAERADLIVDFTGMGGQTVTMSNDEPGETVDLPEIMQFRVSTSTKGKDKSCDPANPDSEKGICARKNQMVHLTDGAGHILPGVKIDKVRQIVLDENFDVPVTLEESLNNTKWDGLESPSIAAEFPSDGVSETPRQGSIELWEIANIYTPGTSAQMHPIHTHLAQFQILNRQALNVNGIGGYYSAWTSAFGLGPAPLPSSCHPGKFCVDYGPPLSYGTPNADGAVGGNPAISPFLQGDVIPPDAGESGWKDSALVRGSQVLRLLVRWTPTDTPLVQNQSYAGTNLYSFDPTDGYYVWHCHIIDHEDNEMMRPYKVTK